MMVHNTLGEPRGMAFYGRPKIKNLKNRGQQWLQFKVEAGAPSKKRTKRDRNDSLAERLYLCDSTKSGLERGKSAAGLNLSQRVKKCGTIRNGQIDAFGWNQTLQGAFGHLRRAPKKPVRC